MTPWLHARDLDVVGRVTFDAAIQQRDEAWAEVARLREALRYIADNCGDDSRAEDNPVRLAREALEAGERQ